MTAASTLAFSWYQLRTTEPALASAFYETVLGRALPTGAVTLLPERARSRGAPPNWVGHLGPCDVVAISTRIVELGGELLGPQTADLALVRDPLGSVVALRSAASPTADLVAWHELNTADRERAWSIYGALCGWTAVATLPLDMGIGPYQTFAWGHAAVGGIVGSAVLSHVHPHWLFHFTVDDVARAIDATRTTGGNVMTGPVEHVHGGRVAYCEDAQGAAFALYERRP